ncbi:hypothetical protein ACFY3O_28465 [Streptomyces sp. NPDC001046]|uniref:hypothetical protein n=1 Tax=Streptomyces sp. NPDC001046 TaxID=3364543 RepID=UPI0036B41874
MARNKAALAAVCGVTTMTLWLSGCGGQGSQSDKPSGVNSESDQRAKALDCLREKGAEVTDPKPGSLPAIQPGKLSPEELQKAMKDCGAGGGQGAGGITEQAKDKMLKYAACMREKDFDVPDPEFVGGQAKLPRVAVPDDRKDAYEAASLTCSQELG